MSEDHDNSNPARRITNEKHEAKTRDDSQAATERDHQQLKGKLQRDYDLKKQEVDSKSLDLALAQAQAMIEAAKKGASHIPVATAVNIYYEAFKGLKSKKDLLLEAIALLKSDAVEIFKNDPIGYRKRIIEIKEFYDIEFAILTKNPTRK